jgi:hypothetical protein
MGILDRIFRKGGPEDVSGDVMDELENPFEKKSAEKKKEWRTTPEPEFVLGEEQREAIDTALIKAQAFLENMKQEEETRTRAKKKLSMYDARQKMDKFKSYTAFATVLENGKPAQKIEAAIHVLMDQGLIAEEKLAHDRQRLVDFQEKLGDKTELNEETLTILQSIGADIERDEQDFSTSKEAVQALTGKA